MSDGGTPDLVHPTFRDGKRRDQGFGAAHGRYPEGKEGLMATQETEQTRPCVWCGEPVPNSEVAEGQQPACCDDHRRWWRRRVMKQ